MAGVWVGSAEWDLVWVGDRAIIDLGAGAAAFRWYWDRLPHDLRGTLIFRSLSEVQDMTGGNAWAAWRTAVLPEFNSSGMCWRCSVPLWLFLIPLLIPTARAWLARSIVPGACPRCGYDRAGLPAATPCPECNAPPPADPHSGHTDPAASPARS